MNKNEEVTLQERLDALEYETGSRMDMFDSAIRNAGGLDQPEEVTFTDKLKQAGNWIVNHKEELLVASVTVVTGAVLYALYKSQKNGKRLPRSLRPLVRCCLLNNFYQRKTLIIIGL